MLRGRYMRTATRAIFLGLLLLAAPGASHAQDGVPVDLELVLAIDSSSSVDYREFNLQLKGYEDAFLDPVVLSAIAGGEIGSIAATLLIWAGDGGVRTIAEWALIEDEASAAAFVAAFRKAPRYMLRDGTSLSSVIDRAAVMFAGNGFDGVRKLIDISGDGTNNTGRPPAEARDTAVAAGITINGLAILNEFADLDVYFAEHVVGGDGAFIIAARNFDVFSAAILNKLALEIAGIPGPMPKLAAAAGD
jgi:hypothetical protein